MKLKSIDKVGTVAAVLIALLLVFFPILNQCQTEDSTACTWNAAEQGNGRGHSFTNYYGVNLYHPWSFTE